MKTRFTQSLLLPVLTLSFALIGCKKEASSVDGAKTSVTAVEYDSSKSISVEGQSLDWFSTAYLESSTGETMPASIQVLSSGELLLTTATTIDFNKAWRVVLDANLETPYRSEYMTMSAPYQVDLELNGAALYSQSLTVAITGNLVSSAGDVAEVAFAESEAACASATTFVGYTPGLSTTFSAGEGLRTLWAKFKSSAGLVSTCVSDSITVDTIAPVVTVTENPLYLNSTNHASFSFSGTCEDGTNVDYEITKNADNSSALTGSAVCAAGTYSVPTASVTNSDGAYTLTVDQTDLAGHSASASSSVIYDTVLPTATLGGLPNNPDSIVTTNSVSVTPSETSTYAFVIISGNASTCSTQTFSSFRATSIPIVTATIPSGDGLRTICLIYKDTAGNESPDSYTWLKDSTPASLSLSSISVGNFNSSIWYTNSATPTLTFTVSDTHMPTGVTVGSTCTGDSAAISGGTAAVTLSTPLTANANTNLCARTTDGAGNVTTLNFTIKYDNIVPTISITGPTVAPVLSGMNAAGSATYSVTSSGGNSFALDGKVSLVPSGTASCSFNNSTADGGVTYSVEVHSCTGDGTVKISINQGAATDYATNESVATTAATAATVDNTAPSGSITIDEGLTTIEQEIDLTISIGDASTMKVTEGSCGTGSSVAAANSVTDYRHSGNPGSTVTINVELADVYGNAACVSDSIDMLYLTVVSQYSLATENYITKWLHSSSTEAAPVPCSPFDGSSGHTGTECFWAGERRKVVTAEISCADLSMQDTEMLFDWTCDDNAGAGPAVFRSRLKPGKKLQDLVEVIAGPTAKFIDNKVTLTKASGVTAGSMQSELVSDWWPDNSFGILPNSSAAVISLSVPGRIYVNDSNMTSQRGYSILANHVAVVSLNGVWLTAGSLSYCYSTTSKCLIKTTNTLFNWIEANLDVNNVAAGSGLVLLGPRYSRFQHMSIKKNLYNAIWVDPAASELGHSNFFRSLNIQNGTGTTGMNFGTGISSTQFSEVGISKGAFGILTYNGVVNSAFYGVSVASQTNAGMYLSSTPVILGDNVFDKIRGYNCSGPPINIINIGLNKFSNVLLASSVVGMLLDGSSNNSITNITTYGIQNQHISVNGDRNRLHNVFSYNSGNTGIGLEFTAGNVEMTLSQFGMGDIGVSSGNYLVTEANARFSGVFLRPPSALCNGNGGDVTASCSLINASATTSFVRNTTGVPAFPGVVSTTAFGSILEFLNLATFFHFWGPVDAAAPYELPGMNPTNCLSGNCSQWNVGFASVDTQFLKKSGDGVNAVATPNPGDPCPMLNTDYIVENYVSPQTYLRLASEIMNPDNPYYGAGDHDGLCEANEKCIYNPNFGAYQGHGSLAQCAYSGTTVSGVSMYFYSNNGF